MKESIRTSNEQSENQGVINLEEVAKQSMTNGPLRVDETQANVPLSPDGFAPVPCQL